jgi:hypothetical protein
MRKPGITIWALLVFLLAGSPMTFQVAAQTNEELPAAVQTNFSPSVAEVVKLADSGMEESVLLNYIHNSPATFQLSADEIIYLRDLGISSPVISAMLQHEGNVSGQSAATQSNEQQIPPAAGSFTNLSSTNVVSATNLNAPVSYTTNAPPEVQHFYDALAPYGTWIFIENQGWCWQPNIVTTRSDWQPYRDDGHWVWTDAGWFWASDYSWGWAPFHYGRWWLSPQWGWVWFPDTTWSPSWVTWRTYENYCGWAPLPPTTIFVDNGFRFRNTFVGFGFDFGLSPDCFTFVDFPHFFFHDFHHRHLRRDRVHQFFNRCKVVNHFAFDRHKRIINRGIDVNHVARFTGKRIDTARVVDAPSGSNRFHHPRQVVRNGKTVEVVRTPLPNAPSTRKTFVAQKAESQRRIVPSVPQRLEREGQSRRFSGGMTRSPTRGTENLNAPREQRSAPTFTQSSGSTVNRFNRAQPGEREQRAVVPTERPHQAQTVNPERPIIRERAGAPVPQRRPETPSQNPAPKMTPPPAQNPPVERFRQPVDRIHPPVERINPPVERINPPVERVNPPVQRINPPVERINPPVEQPPMPRPSAPQRQFENRQVAPANPPPSRPSKNFDEHQRGRP